MGVVFGYLGILVIIGALLCFKGRDLFRPAIAVFTFWMVYSGLMGLLNGTDDRDFVIAILAGLVGALLSGFVLKLGVFVAGLVAGLSLGTVLFDLFPQIREMAIPKVAFLVVVTILVGILTVKAIDMIIMISTAGLGATLMAVPCVYMLFSFPRIAQSVDPAPIQTITNVNRTMFVRVAQDHPLPVLCGMLVLFIAGIIVQHKTNHKRHDK